MIAYFDWVETTSKYTVYISLSFKCQDYCSCLINEKGERNQSLGRMTLGKYLLFCASNFFPYRSNGKHCPHTTLCHHHLTYGSPYQESYRTWIGWFRTQPQCLSQSSQCPSPGSLCQSELAPRIKPICYSWTQWSLRSLLDLAYGYSETNTSKRGKIISSKLKRVYISI